MGEPEKRYWFPAKRYGWGWGMPATWQGWVVMMVWLIVFVPGSTLLAQRGYWLGFVLFALLMSGSLFAICYVKGEPPRWRWGGE